MGLAASATARASGTYRIRRVRKHLSGIRPVRTIRTYPALRTRTSSGTRTST